MTSRVTNAAAGFDTDHVRPLVEALDDSALALDRVRLAPGERVALAERGDDRDHLLYAFEGAGVVSIGEGSHELPAAAAALVLAGEDAQLEAGPAGLGAIRASVGTSVDLHAPLGRREVVVPVEEADSDRATGA